MSTRINTNTTAVMASHNLNVNSDHESTDIQRLSTGLRINSAADDAAGLVISQNMNAQLVGLNQATSNTNDAINEVKTAENALGEVQNLLMTMRQLAVDASNQGVNDSTDVSADQEEINSAIKSINRISDTTQFGTKKLLDGSASSSVTTTTGSAVAGGSGAVIASEGRWNSGNAYDYTNLTVNKATATTGVVNAKGNDFTGKLTINGVTYDLGDKGTDVEGLNTKIEASGYTATQKGGKLVFTSNSPGASPATQTIDTSTLKDNNKAVGNAQVTQGTDATLTLRDVKGHTLDSVASIRNGDGTNSYVFSNGLIVNATDKAGTLTGAFISGKAGASSRGMDLQFQIGANQGQTTSANIGSTAADQIGQNAGPYVDTLGNKQVVETDSVSDINVTTFKGSQDAIAVIDKAITDISEVRAALGAFQTNILQSNANSLNVASQNLSSSKSTITDADLASTVVSYTKDSILVQSATSALSYANQLPQQVLKLLQ